MTGPPVDLLCSAAALHARMHAYGTVRGPPTGLAV